MKKSRFSLLLFGIPSLFLIFTVLSMIILSLMTYAASKTDLSAGEAALHQTMAYYDACTEATTHYEELLSKLQNIYDSSDREETYLRQISQTDFSVWDWNSDAKTFTLLLPFSQEQSLSVVLAPEYSASLVQIRQWNTVLTKDWVPDNTLPLLSDE